MKELHLALPDGRKLEVLSAQSGRIPLIFHYGTPCGAVPFEPLLKAAAARGLRTVVYSRPGYGGSTSRPGRAVADVAADVEQICSALGASTFVTVGWSGGGPHALACAALLPDRCAAAATIAGIAPFDASGLEWLAGMGPENVSEFTAAAKGPAALTAFLKEAAPPYAQATSADIAAAFGGLVSEVDKASLTGDFAEFVARMVRSALSRGIEGWREDDLAFVRHWGFRLDQIRVPVSVWQGGQDRMVPYAHGAWLAKNIPGARAHLEPEEGHLSLAVGSLDRILDDLLGRAAASTILAWDRDPSSMAAELQNLSAAELGRLKQQVDQRLLEIEKGRGGSLVEALGKAQTVDLVAIAVKRGGIRCRVLETGDAVTLRPGAGLRREAEAHILRVRPAKAWSFKRTVYLAGEILNMRLDIPALKLVPIKVKEQGVWDPANEYRFKDDGGVPEWLRPSLAAGPRPTFEMEDIYPGYDVDDPDSEPSAQAVDLMESGDHEGAMKVLHRALEADLRYLDGHAHLGVLMFGDGSRRFAVERAKRHYEAGVAIAEWSFGAGFRGVLEWSDIYNRPFLRCLHGLGLCHWALGDFEAAARAFERLLWFDPSDHRGVAECLDDVKARRRYEYEPDLS